MKATAGSRRQAGMLIAAGALVLADNAHATIQPLVLPSVYTEPYAGAALPAPAPKCTIRFDSLVDKRRDPSIAGIVGRRAILPPADVQSWLASILQGLARRGVLARFDPDAGASPTGTALPSATLELNLVWLMPVGTNFSANVVFTVDATAASGLHLQDTFRGRSAHTDWFNGNNEKIGAINAAIADALDKMAPRLLRLCS